MLREYLQNHKVILASGSPRRQQFFKDLDVDFEIRIKEVDEIYPPELSASEITDFLAKLKSEPFTDLKDNEILVTSDTIVWHENRALGKPKNYDDALQILRSLSGKTHDVITSVCFTTNQKSEIINDITKVTFDDLTDAEIAYYLDNYKPYDKAGSYGIQEWVGFVAVSKIEGSYANVMGLPVHKVYEYLRNFEK